MRLLRPGLAALACAALASILSTNAPAGPVTFTQIDRATDAILIIDGESRNPAHQESSAIVGPLPELIAFTGFGTATTDGRVTSQQTAFIQTAPDAIGSSGSLQLQLTGASPTDSASARAKFAATFDVTHQLLYSLNANMAANNVPTFSGKLKLQRGSVVLIDTEITPAQSTFENFNEPLLPGQYSLSFEPRTDVTGSDVNGNAVYALFVETAVPLPPAAFAALAPLALVAWRNFKKR